MRLTFVFICFAILLLNCDYFGYARAMAKEGRRNFIGIKKFFAPLNLVGEVIELETCDGCKNIGHYKMYLKLETPISDDINPDDLTGGPYYDLTKLDTVRISLQKKLFCQLKLGDKIKKEGLYLRRGDDKFPYLSSDTLKWFVSEGFW